MRRPELDSILATMLRAHDGISDLVFIVGKPFQVESDGELRAVVTTPRIEALTAFQTQKIALNILGDNRRLLRELLEHGACDCSYQLDAQTRFRANVFRQRGHFGIVMRRTQSAMPTLDGLGLPPIFRAICREKDGLILVTGATGSGKTSTLSAMLDEINKTQAVHVVTLEDPVELVHAHKRATFTQREFGTDFDDFPTGLRSALRQAPKVILVGEMRDRATVEIALTAAETGHLVLSTLNTIGAGPSINRILGMFEVSEQPQLRLRFMEMLRYTVSQRLVPRLGGGRHLAQEIMGSNFRVREIIAHGESEERLFADAIESNSAAGWASFDQSLLQACAAGQIAEETALLYAAHKNKFARLLDLARKDEDKAPELSVGFRLDRAAVPKASALSGEIRLKL